jgi:hypothetical protein
LLKDADAVMIGSETITRVVQRFWDFLVSKNSNARLLSN